LSSSCVLVFRCDLGPRFPLGFLCVFAVRSSFLFVCVAFFLLASFCQLLKIFRFRLLKYIFVIHFSFMILFKYKL